jgi:anti-sigma B factor antagonist
MPEPKLMTDVRFLNHGLSAIDIVGDLSGYAEAALMEAYNQATSRGANTVILNFSKLDYMNSSGIGLLVTLLVRAQRQGQKLIAVGLNEHYQHIFELTRLNEAIQSFATEAEATVAVS